MDKLEQLEKSLKEYRELLEKAKKKHEDEAEDKEMIAEAIDEHNEKKHGEAKDEDSAFKTDVIKFDANGQWSLDKSHKKLNQILNDYESEDNPKFKRSHIKNTFTPSEVKAVVDANASDPDHSKDSTIKITSDAYHKAVESEPKMKKGDDLDAEFKVHGKGKFKAKEGMKMGSGAGAERKDEWSQGKLKELKAEKEKLQAEAKSLKKTAREEILEELEKAKVNEEAHTSPSIMRNDRSVEGGAKDAKYQGGDPRHADPDSDNYRGDKTKSGQSRKLAISDGEGEKYYTHTRGRSTINRSADYKDKKVPVRGGKPGQREKWNN